MKFKSWTKIIYGGLTISPICVVVSCTTNPLNNENIWEILENYKKQFKKIQETQHKDLYPKNWHPGDIKTFKELGIEEPENEFNIPAPIYIIQKIDFNKREINVQVNLKYNKEITLAFDICVTFLQTESANELAEIVQFLQKNKPKVYNPQLLPSDIDAQNIFDKKSGIQWWTNPSFLNKYDIKLVKVNDYNDEIGLLDITIKIQRKNNKNLSQEIQIKWNEGLLTNDKVYQKIIDFINNFQQNNPIDLEYKIKKDNTWNQTFNHFYRLFENEFSPKVIQQTKWEISHKTEIIAPDINLIKGDNGITGGITGNIWFKFDQRESQLFKIYFQNISLTSEEINIYQVKKTLQPIINNPIISHISSLKAEEIFKKSDKKQILDAEEMNALFGITIPTNELQVSITGQMIEYLKSIPLKNETYDILTLKITLTKKETRVTIAESLTILFS